MIVLFGGTTEGRLLTQRLEAAHLPAYVCVATAYGQMVLPENMRFCRVREGRMDEAAMEIFFRKTGASLVLDATHPYADLVSRNIRRAAGRLGLDYVRIGRPTGGEAEDAVYFDSPRETAAYLGGCSGNVLLTTGSKELAAFTGVEDFAERIYIRILPLKNSEETAKRLGWREDHICMKKGPFSEEENMAAIRWAGARYLVTKDSGAAGGMPEKISAARRCGCTLLVIRRPVQETGVSVEQAWEIVREAVRKTEELP